VSASSLSLQPPGATPLLATGVPAVTPGAMTSSNLLASGRPVDQRGAPIRPSRLRTGAFSLCRFRHKLETDTEGTRHRNEDAAVHVQVRMRRIMRASLSILFFL